MQLGVYSLEKVLYHDEAVEVNCRTQIGDITILDKHEPLISVLAAGTMTIIDKSGHKYYIPVRSGFLEVGAKNQARILVEEP